MKRLLSLLVAVSFLLSLSACGNIFIRGALNTSTVSGFVSIVQIASGSNGGTTVLITFVTFLQSGTSSTIGFCGDQRSQFPFNQMVTAQFTAGTPCSNIVSVVII